MEGDEFEDLYLHSRWRRDARHALPDQRDQRGWKDYVCYFPRSVGCYFERVLAIFSWRFVLFLFFSQFFVKGTLNRLSMGSMLPLFKGLGIDAADFQLYMMVAMIPWALKPLIGLASDLVVLWGYHKRWWMVQSIVVGVFSSAMIFVIYAAGAGPGVLVLCFMGIHYEISTLDLLSEGKYAQVMRDNPSSGSDIITLVNGYQNAGGIIAMTFIGVMADNGYWKAMFAIFTVLSVVPLVPTLLGWLPEKKRSTTEVDLRWTRGCGRDRATCKAAVMVDWRRLRNQTGVILVVGFAGLSGPIMAIISTYGNRMAGAITATLMIVGALAGSKLAFSPMVFKVALYQTLSAISKPSIGGALDYFYTADEACLPGGPHFSFTYYLTFTGLVGSAVSFVAVWIYQGWLSKWRFRSVLIFTTILVGAGGFMDLILVMRWNIDLGVNDHVAYIAGEAVLETVIIMLYWIPSSAILSKVVPEGMESSSYAFLAGLSNFSSMFSELTGSMIYDAAGVKTTTTTSLGDACDFTPLWWLVIAFHIVLPVMIGVPASLLIPNCKQTEDLNPDGSVRRQPRQNRRVIEGDDLELEDDFGDDGVDILLDGEEGTDNT